MAYRLIRQSDLTRERDAAAATLQRAENWALELDHKLDVAHASALETVRSAFERERELLEELADMQGKLQAALTHADFVTTRVNVLEHEVAQYRQLARPEVRTLVAAIGKTPVGAELFQGAGADLFEDVGDVEAERLRKLNLLHDPASPLPDVASVGSASPDFVEP
jgi:hypothetical protein